jgi:hypothetical protein
MVDQHLCQLKVLAVDCNMQWRFEESIERIDTCVAFQQQQRHWNTACFVQRPRKLLVAALDIAAVVQQNARAIDLFLHGRPVQCRSAVVALQAGIGLVLQQQSQRLLIAVVRCKVHKPVVLTWNALVDVVDRALAQQQLQLLQLVMVERMLKLREGHGTRQVRQFISSSPGLIIPTHPSIIVVDCLTTYVNDVWG